MTACTDSSKTLLDVVKFNDIKTNINMHNLSHFKSKGKLMIETEGLYLVSTWISHTNGASYALYRNGIIITSAYTQYDTVDIYGGGTTTAIVSIELKAGDAIWVKTTKTTTVYGSYSCFTVVKLK